MWRLLRQWRLRDQEESDLGEEMRAHLLMEVRRRVEAGEDPIDAEHAARREFGNATKFHEDARETWGWAALGRFLDDAGFGLRMLRKTPLWTTVVCLTLAMGIGLSTAIFSVVYSVLLHPLPYPDSDRIVTLRPITPTRVNVSAALWMHWRENAKLFADIALTRPIANFNITGDGAPERLQGARTSANLTAVLGVTPLLGRVFTEEERSRDAKVAILSHGLWQRRFGGDSKVLGRKIPLNGVAFEVIGVMPQHYRYPNRDFELWTPLYLTPGELRDGIPYQYLSVGRLKRNVPLDQARAEMVAIMKRLAEDRPEIYRENGQYLQPVVQPLAETDSAKVRSTLYALLAAAGCLLLIGCMNLGVMLIARASARGREMAVRVALGASGHRLRRQLLAEILPLSLAGAAGGILMAMWLLQALLPWLPAGTPRIDEIAMHGPALGFAVGASLLVVLLAGLLPSHIGSRADLAGALHRSSRAVTGAGKARDVLVIAQIAATVTLLFSGTLFARSFHALLQVNPGFQMQGALTMHLAVTRAKYSTDPQVSAYYERLIARVSSIRGVAAAGIVNRMPLTGITQTGPVEFEGKQGRFNTDWRSATPGYFEAIGIPLKRGRLFSTNDRAASPAVGLIDDQLAYKVFGDEDPIGKRFRIHAGVANAPWCEIVGVVGHILNDTPERDSGPQVYWPQAQRTQDRGALVVRTDGNPESFAAAVIEQIRKEDADQPVYDVRALEQWMGRTLQSRSLLTALLGLFGGAALLLACLGLYGVVSYNAGLRMREFGIRMALGAGAAHVRGLVLRDAAKLALWGSVFGLMLAWPAGRAIGGLLFRVTMTDSVSWMLTPALLIAVALLAAFGPARRAATMAPSVTLRMLRTE